MNQGHRTRREFGLQLAGCTAGLLLAAGCGLSLLRPGAPKVWRIGYLSPGERALDDEVVSDKLRDLGHVDGRDIEMVWRFAENRPERLPALAEELVSLQVDVLVALATPAARAAKAATTTIPIVFMLVNDPVGQQLVPNLARPGGNVTGFSTLSGAISGKRLELLRAVSPRVSRVGVFWNATNAGMALALEDTLTTAAAMSLQIRPFGIRVPEDAPPALDVAVDEGLDGFIALPSLDNRVVSAITEAAARHRVPAVFSDAGPARAGGLLGLGPDYNELRRGAAGYVDRIMRGARPGDLPVEQPTKFDLAVNMRTAETLGLTIPRHVLLEATEVVR